jgi:hypothetical protein
MGILELVFTFYLIIRFFKGSSWYTESITSFALGFFDIIVCIVVPVLTSDATLSFDEKNGTCYWTIG